MENTEMKVYAVYTKYEWDEKTLRGLWDSEEGAVRHIEKLDKTLPRHHKWWDKITVQKTKTRIVIPALVELSADDAVEVLWSEVTLPIWDSKEWEELTVVEQHRINSAILNLQSLWMNDGILSSDETGRVVDHVVSVLENHFDVEKLEG